MIIPTSLMQRKRGEGGSKKTLLIAGVVVGVVVLVFGGIAAMSAGTPEQTEVVVDVPFK